MKKQLFPLTCLSLLASFGLMGCEPSSASSSSLASVSSSIFTSISSEEAASLSFGDTVLTSTEEIEIGTTVDMSPFVIVSPSSAAWTLSSSSPAIRIDGKSFTAVAVGPYTLTVSAKGTSKDLKGLVISKELNAIKDFDADNGLSNCTNYLVKLYKDETLIATGYHNDSFVYRKSAVAEYDDSGYLTSMNEGTCFAFLTDKDGVLTVGEEVENGLQSVKFGDAFPFTITDYVDEMDPSGVATGRVAILNRPVAIPACTEFLLGIDSSSLMSPDEITASYSEEGQTVTYAFLSNGVPTGYTFVLSSLQEVNSNAFPELSTIWDWIVNN